MPVTFTARRICTCLDDYRCNETGVHYQIERRGDGYLVRNSGKVVACRSDRDDAITFIEQLANLDFRTAQADSAFSVN